MAMGTSRCSVCRIALSGALLAVDLIAPATSSPLPFFAITNFTQIGDFPTGQGAHTNNPFAPA